VTRDASRSNRETDSSDEWDDPDGSLPIPGSDDPVIAAVAADFRSHLVGGALIALVFVGLGDGVVQAVSVGGLFVAFHVINDAADAAVGDYAGNGLFGVGLLIVVAWGVTTGAVPPIFLAGGLLLGAWFLFDGVQHLRYGVERDGRIRGVSLPDDAGPLRRAPRLVVGRVLEPFRLGE
jgi:hypothetical protein